MHRSSNDDEEAWVYALDALVWPPTHIFRLNPFQRDMLPNERLNAQARMTILVGLVVFGIAYSRGDAAAIYLFWTVLHLMNLGVSFLHTEDGKRLEEEKRYEAERERYFAALEHHYRQSVQQHYTPQGYPHQPPQQNRHHQQRVYGEPYATKPPTLYEHWLALGYGDEQQNFHVL